MPYYAVARGRVPGIYESWPEAEAQVRGFRGAIHIKKGSRGEAEAWLRANMGGTMPAASGPRPGQNRASAEAGVPTLIPVSALSFPLGPLLLYFDGGARGNPGRGGAGSVVYVQDSLGRACKVWEACTFLPHCTNNEAEYTGLVIGLRWLRAQGVKGRVQVRGDSLLVVKQLRGEYTVHAPNLLSLYNEARSISSAVGQVTFAHVYREGNGAADACGNEACDRGHSIQRLTVAQAEWTDILSRYTSDNAAPPTYSRYVPPAAQARGSSAGLGLMQPITLGAGSKRGREEGASGRQAALKPRSAYDSDSSSSGR